MIRRGLALLGVAIFGTGCSVRLGDFTVGSPKNIPTQLTVKRARVTGKDCVMQVLGIPIGTLNPTIDGAVDNALEQVPGADALTDVAIYRDFFTLVLFQQICVRVEGKAVSTRS